MPRQTRPYTSRVGMLAGLFGLGGGGFTEEDLTSDPWDPARTPEDIRRCTSPGLEEVLEDDTPKEE